MKYPISPNWFAQALAVGLLSLLVVSCTWLETSTPTASPTILPTNTDIQLPDLVVLSAALENQSSDECRPSQSEIGVRIVIKNQGNASSGPFVVEVNRSRQTIQAGLEPQNSVDLWFQGNSENINIWVDVTYLVPEKYENNNQATLRLLLPTVPPVCKQTAIPSVTIEQPLFTMSGHTGKVCSVAFSPDGTLIASASVDNSMRFWQVSEGILLRKMLGHPFPVLAVSFSTNGTLLASGSSDARVRIWGVSNGQLQSNLVGHAGWVNSVDFSPDGRYVASAADDFTVRLWRTIDNSLVYTIDEGLALPSSVMFSPDGKLLAWAESNGDVRIWRISDHSWIHIMSIQSARPAVPATSVVFSPDGAVLAAGYGDGTIRIWNTSDGSLINTTASHPKAITSLSFSTDGSLLLSASQDTSLRLWQVNRSEGGNTQNATPTLGIEWSISLDLLRIYNGHSLPVTSSAISPSGDLVVSGSEDGTVRIWQIPAIR